MLLQTDSIDGGNGNKNRFDDNEDDKGDINWPQWVPEFLRLDYGDIATVSTAKNNHVPVISFSKKATALLALIFPKPSFFVVFFFLAFETNRLSLLSGDR